MTRIVVFALLFLGLLVIMKLMDCGDFIDTQTRSNVSKVKADLRSLATAIEAYYVDHERYPASSTSVKYNVFSAFRADTGKLDLKIPTFITTTESGEVSQHLTTPISYISNYFMDPFTRAKKGTYAYWRQDLPIKGEFKFTGWIAWSPGPDGKYDLTIHNIANLYDNTQKVPSEGLLKLSYDPTNGELSDGDIYRTKQ